MALWYILIRQDRGRTQEPPSQIRDGTEDHTDPSAREPQGSMESRTEDQIEPNAQEPQEQIEDHSEDQIESSSPEPKDRKEVEGVNKMDGNFQICNIASFAAAGNVMLG